MAKKKEDNGLFCTNNTKLMWINKEEIDFLTDWRNKRTVEFFEWYYATEEEKKLLEKKWEEKKEEETFYYVNLANSDDTIHTTGMKSRKTGKIYLTNFYTIDLTQPIENTDFHYVRDSTPMDI